MKADVWPCPRKRPWGSARESAPDCLCCVCVSVCVCPCVFDCVCVCVVSCPNDRKRLHTMAQARAHNSRRRRAAAPGHNQGDGGVERRAIANDCISTITGSRTCHDFDAPSGRIYFVLGLWPPGGPCIRSQGSPAGLPRGGCGSLGVRGGARKNSA